MSDVEFGISMKDFIIEEADLSKIFLPIASFHDEKLSSSNEEIVAAIEGGCIPMDRSFLQNRQNSIFMEQS